MAQHDFVIDNQTGANFRADLNNALAALVSLSSGATEPATKYAYQLWVDTSTTPATIRQRNSANNAWVAIGTLTTNLGLQPAGNYVVFDTATGAATVPAGSTAQRPASPSAAQLRFNSTLSKFEGYNGSVWGSIGGGATGGGTDDIFYENGKTVTQTYTIGTNKNAMTAGPITVNSGVTVTVPTGSRWVIV